MARLTIKYSDNGVFTDYSSELENFLRDSATITMVSGEDVIYVGYYKPVNEFYVAMSTKNTESINLSVKYYNGSSYTAVTNLHDGTNNLLRDGFIKFDNNIDDQELSTVDSVELYWYEISADADTSAMVITGINQLFSDDLDIEEDEPGIIASAYYPDTYTSYLLYHQSVRNDIVQHLRNEGHRKYNDGVTDWKNINQFDIHDREELRTASKYKVLGKIYFNLSDSPDDKYFQKYLVYEKMANEALNLFFLSLDSDDDGKEDDFERVALKFGRIIRI